MIYQHQELSTGRWFNFSLSEQIANTGSEVGRTINWRNKGNQQYANKAFERALELLDLTIADKKNIKRLKELTRLREVLVDYFFGDNQHQSSDQLWQKYFYAFNYAARIDH